MKIWLLTEFYYPMLTSTGYIMTDIAERLSKDGHDINVICTDSTYNGTKEYEYIGEEIHNGVHIFRIKAPEFDKNNYKMRIKRLLYTSLMITKVAFLKIHTKDLILAVTNPSFLILLLPILKYVKGLNYSIIVQDVFPENLLSIGSMSENSFIYKLTKWLYNNAYIKANRCITCGEDMSNIIKVKTKNRVPTITITNYAEPNKVNVLPKEQTLFYKKYLINVTANTIIFQFAGNLGRVQGIKNLLDAIDLVSNINMLFIFIGNGAEKPLIEKFTKNHTNTLLFGYQDRAKQNDFLNACDIGIVTLGPNMYGLGVPSKAYNIMATGKAILFIGDKNSEIALQVQKYHIGWVVDANNPYALIETLNMIYDCKSELKDMGKRARQLAETIFSKDYVLEQYSQLYK